MLYIVSSKRNSRVVILESARRLLRRRAGVPTLEEVAREAGVSRQAVYLHFPSRIELLIAVASHANERARLEELNRPVEQASTAKALLVALGRMAAQYFPLVVDASLPVEALCLTDRAFGRAWLKRPFNRLTRMQGIAARLHASGALMMSAHEAADLLWTLVSPWTFEHLVLRRGWSKEQLGEHLGALLVRALLDPARTLRPVPPLDAVSPVRLARYRRNPTQGATP